MKVPPALGDLWPEPAGAPLADSGTGSTPGRITSCLARGWWATRPRDSLTLLPVAGGRPGLTQMTAPDRVAPRKVIQGQGPLGQVGEIDLVRLVPRPSRSGSRHPAEASTWFLDAARPLALPSDPDEAAQEALEGSTSGLGEVIDAVLNRTDPLDTLIVRMSCSAVHDGGLGAIDALGGLRTTKNLLSHHDLGLALADDISLRGMNGAGATLTSIASISPERARELNRRACAKAIESVRAAEDLDPGGLNTRRSPPVVSTPGDTGPSVSVHTADSAGAIRLSMSTWGTGAGGDSALLLRALGAWAQSGTRVMTELVCLNRAAYGQDLVVSAWGELYNVLADGVVGVAGRQTASRAQPCILVCGRCAVSHGELVATGVINTYGLQEAHATEPWEAADSHGLEAWLVDLGSRLIHT